MLSGLVNVLDSLFIWLNSGLKQNLSDYVDLETGQDEFTLATKDGSLLSILRVDGYKSLINILFVCCERKIVFISYVLK